ncbi:hypothetical protein N181_01860 [Sinorhizobium fredii USDA 205]|uniref:Uncharacterized protein n=1 Tax=Rhizobium fredii TaxID=380 RepID=A0A844AJP1_RHIFR|nr:hypothetical protein [Sinorhizobium fredii]KSV87370.1 hypothetical protein N181_01860 [Sinorhizobium fredii USDA 205]MQX11786.1 hypothetical protein [Sinorhizobium fredii]GEC31686.1 hypothetical protein EFR01_18570 [Sinorhizobium fredii]GLS09009.1 hypothetical protein GCM10007864_26390 [Sinorhizobium fredii]
MQSDVSTADLHMNFAELSRLYELLDEYSRTLTDPTNRPLNVVIFEAFHQWEVQQMKKMGQFRFPGLNLPTEEIEWVWLKSGMWVDYLDEDGRPCEEFGLYGYDDSEGNFVFEPEVRPIPDYIQSLDEALDLKGKLSFAKLRIVELDGDFLTLWRAILLAKDGNTLEDEAATPSVAVLKALLKALIQSPEELNRPKFGPSYRGG